MIFCPCCHRTILAEEFREHILGHKGKKIRRPTEAVTGEAKTKYPEFEEFPKLPGFEEVFEKWTASKPIKSNLSQDQIHAKFVAYLKDVGTNYASLRLDATDEPTVVEVRIDEQRNLVLKYNPLSIRTLTEKAIDGLLLHEACHACTLLDTILRVFNTGSPDMVRFLGNCITNYDEYLAHVEFVRRFRNDPRYEGLREHQVCLFENFDIIVNTLKKMAGELERTGQHFNQFWVLEQVGAIIYDSLFFFVAGDDSFQNWCKSQSLSELFTFTGWIYDDFEHIRSLGLPHKETHDKVMISATLSMSVNPLKLLLLGQIEFADTTKGLHEEWMQKGRDTDLVQMWEKRRQLYREI